MATRMSWNIRVLLAILSVMRCAAIDAIVPPDCSFESGDLCSWIQMSDDDFDWSLRRGRTPTGRTGPDADHSYGNTSGTYIHIESSNRLFMERAKIESPIMNSFLLGQNQCEFSLYYHMYGDDVWELRACVQMLADGSCFQGNPVVASSNQGNIWKKYTQALPASQGQFKIVIEGVVGTGSRGDIAIDDLVFSEGCHLTGEFSVLLDSDASLSAGILQVFHGGVTKRVCASQNMGNIATVACRELGYKSGTAQRSTVTAPLLPLLPFTFECTAVSRRLRDCTRQSATPSCQTAGEQEVINVQCEGYQRQCQSHDEFTCDNENCIPQSGVCDFRDTCGDVSDEKNCTHFPARCDFNESSACMAQWIVGTGWTSARGDSSGSGGPTSDHNGRNDTNYLLMAITSAGQKTVTFPHTIIPDQHCKFRFYYWASRHSSVMSVSTPYGRLMYPLWSSYGRYTVDMAGTWQYYEVPISVGNSPLPSAKISLTANPDSHTVVAIDDVTLTPSCGVVTSVTTATSSIHTTKNTSRGTSSSTLPSRSTVRSSTTRPLVTKTSSRITHSFATEEGPTTSTSATERRAKSTAKLGTVGLTTKIKQPTTTTPKGTTVTEKTTPKAVHGQITTSSGNIKSTNSGQNSVDGGLMAGIVVAVLLLGIIVGGLVIFFVFRARNQKPAPSGSEPAVAYYPEPHYQSPSDYADVENTYATLDSIHGEPDDDDGYCSPSSHYMTLNNATSRTPDGGSDDYDDDAPYAKLKEKTSGNARVREGTNLKTENPSYGMAPLPPAPPPPPPQATPYNRQSSFRNPLYGSQLTAATMTAIDM